MKTTLLMLMTLLALPAWTDEPDFGRLGVVAVTEPDGTALKQHMAKAEAEIKAVGDRVLAEVCPNRAQYDGNPEKFAAKVAKWNADVLAIQARYVADLDKVLTPTDSERIKQKASSLQKINEIDTTDTPDRIRDGTINLKDALDATCGGTQQ